MSLANRLENAPSHASLIRASKATNWYLDGTFAMSFFGCGNQIVPIHSWARDRCK